jgi:aspartate/methionine/tyrosine aminotransferase
MPDIVLDAFARSAPLATGYPPAIGTPAYREAAAGWLDRRFGVELDPSAVVACIGTKEAVASLPRLLHLRNPERDTVLYPAVAYPTYEMGAQLAGLRPQFSAQLALRLGHMGVGRRLVYRQRLKGVPGAGLRQAPRLLDGAFQLSA